MMRGGLVTKSVGAGAVLAAIVTVVSFMSPGAAFELAVAGGVLRALVLVGLGHDMAVHVGVWRMRWFAYLMAALEAAFVILTLANIPVEAHFGVDGVATASATVHTVGFLVWIAYGIAALAMGIVVTGAPRYRLFGILMIVSAVAWLLVLGILAWPFIIAAAYLALAWRLLRPSLQAAAG